jgi:hypothetical protein
MTVHGVGACVLLSFMRLERRTDADASRLPHGAEAEEVVEQERPAAWRWAAE